MRRFSVNSGRGAYDVLTGRGVLCRDSLDGRLADRHPRIAVISQARIIRLHGSRLFRALGRSESDCAVITIPQGEQAKSVGQLSRVWRRLVEAGITRDGLVVAFGGGLVGDLAGFAAATFLRGINWMNIPTTLLAQVDACVGGKTAINLPEGKNLVGAFHPPCLVIADTGLLASLSRRQVKSGLGEVVKYAIGVDERIFGMCRRLLPGKWDSPSLIRACIEAKASVVSADEFETGRRRLLNLGHTLGHALESAAAGSLLHGEAVAVGLSFALGLSNRLGLADDDFLRQGRSLIRSAGLAMRPLRRLKFRDLRPYLAVDKKTLGRGLVWVLPVSAGRCVFRSGIDEELLVDVYNSL